MLGLEGTALAWMVATVLSCINVALGMFDASNDGRHRVFSRDTPAKPSNTSIFRLCIKYRSLNRTLYLQTVAPERCKTCPCGLPVAISWFSSAFRALSLL